MKKIMIAFCLALFVSGMVTAQLRNGGTMYVAIRTLDLKSGTGLFASTRGTLNYGDRVTVLQVSGNNVEVRSVANSSLSGWTTSSNLSARQVVAGTESSATTREVAMAGKGFNQEVEDAYKSQGTLNYADVDRTEAITVNMADLERFLREGRLSMGDNR